MQQFRVGTVLSMSFRVIAGHFPTLAILFLIPFIPLVLILITSSVFDFEFIDGELIEQGRGAAATSITGIVAFVGSSFALAFLAQPVTSALHGHKSGIFQSFAAVRNSFATIAVLTGFLGVLSLGTQYIPMESLTTALAFFVINIGLFVLFMALWVVIPVTVIETLGVADAWRRSFALTRKRRWQIFGLLIAITGPWMIIIIVFSVMASDALLAGTYSYGRFASVLWGISAPFALFYFVAQNASYFLLTQAEPNDSGLAENS